MKKKFLIIFVISFLLNLFWEVSHSLLYDWSKFPLQNDVSFYILRILKSSFWDGIIILAIFLIIYLIRKDFKFEKIDYYSIIFLGLIFAIFIEIRAKTMNSWSYNQSMPLIFGIGLTPLIQLSITGIIVMFLIKKLF